MATAPAYGNPQAITASLHITEAIATLRGVTLTGSEADQLAREAQTLVHFIISRAEF